MKNKKEIEKLVKEINELELSKKDPLRLRYCKRELKCYKDLEENKIKFKIGDIVTWRSQSSSYYKTKIGNIKAVVPAGESAGNYGYQADMVLPRNHESYLVLVKNKLYWPRVCHLIKC